MSQKPRHRQHSRRKAKGRRKGGEKSENVAAVETVEVWKSEKEEKRKDEEEPDTGPTPTPVTQYYSTFRVWATRD